MRGGQPRGGQNPVRGRCALGRRKTTRNSGLWPECPLPCGSELGEGLFLGPRSQHLRSLRERI